MKEEECYCLDSEKEVLNMSKDAYEEEWARAQRITQKSNIMMFISLAIIIYMGCILNCGWAEKFSAGYFIGISTIITSLAAFGIAVFTSILYDYLTISPKDYYNDEDLKSSHHAIISQLTSAYLAILKNNRRRNSERKSVQRFGWALIFGATLTSALCIIFTTI